MKRIVLLLAGAAGWAFAQPAAPADISVLVDEVRQIRLVIQQQQKLTVMLELFRARVQRIATLEARLDQIETDLSTERRRLAELTTAASAAAADDRTVLGDQYRRASEAIAELESSKVRYGTTLAAETRQQEDLLKSADLK